MIKLKQELEYIKRCKFCGSDTKYLLRASNVNTSITDKDAIRIALQGVGSLEAERCENCNYITQHETVAYSLPEASKEQS